jgi:hypothetical protein
MRNLHEKDLVLTMTLKIAFIGAEAWFVQRA